MICKLLPRLLTNCTCMELPASKFEAPVENYSNSDSISSDVPDTNRLRKEDIFSFAGNIASLKLKYLR